MGCTPRTTLQRFKMSKVYRELVGDGFIIDEDLETKIVEFLDHFDEKDRHGTWKRIIGTWIRHDINDDWVERRHKLEPLLKSTSEYAYQLRYGVKHGSDIYNGVHGEKFKRLPSSIEYWQNTGLSVDEAVKKRREHQRMASSLSPVHTTRKYSPRCVEYWIEKGYSESDAEENLSRYQTRDKQYFLGKYGHDEGIRRYAHSVKMRKDTWSNKSKQERMEHGSKALPKTFNEHGLEAKVLKATIEALGVDELYCKYGAACDQHMELIDGVGFRRYDLVIYADEQHTQLLYVVEYHGLGHINFSDFDETTKDNRILVDGKEIARLNYTNFWVYNNDMVKRQHILDKYPDVKYLVIWPFQYDKNKNAVNINDVLHRCNKPT